jgi:hypothetical protein
MAGSRRQLTDDELFEFLWSGVTRFVNWRSVVIIAVYAAALTLSNVGVMKTTAFCFVIWLLITIPIGRNYLEKAGGVWLFAAMVVWLDIPLVNRFIDLVSLKLAALF